MQNLRNLAGRYNRLAAGVVLASSGLLLGSDALAVHSVARTWNEQQLSAVRRDFARPTIHARNLYHVSVAMWDAWAAYDAVAEQVITHEKHNAVDIQAARNEAISFAAYRVLKHRFATSPGAAVTLPALDAQMDALGYDRTNTSTAGNTPAEVGNRIAANVIAFGLADGSNEQLGYANQYYLPINPPLIVTLPGNPDPPVTPEVPNPVPIDPNRWQPLALNYFKDQNGNPSPFGYPPALSPEWGIVTPYSLLPNQANIYQRDGFDWWVYHDPGTPPLMDSPTQDDYKWGFELVSIWSGQLDPADGVIWDASPASSGNCPLPPVGQEQLLYNRIGGGDWGTGYATNPATGQPYTPQMVPRGDYGRVLAEFWADGPNSETPPGHWYTIANYVADHPMLVKRIGGEGPIVDDLEWDVKVYLALGGTLHDVAIACWGTKGWYDYIRPVSAIRWLAERGQSSDPNAASYNPRGIRLVPDWIELVTPATTAAGGKHEHLAGSEGEIAIYAWRGPDYINDPNTDTAHAGWILAANWWPYQRPTFVSPPFPGYTSGHSTFSRSAALVMGFLTGSEFFPGGLGTFHCPQNQYLVFEEGPSVDMSLQWARYLDASDQCSLSRIWGGIHPPQDDIPGRRMGNIIGPQAFNKSVDVYNKVLGDCTQDGRVDVHDLFDVLANFGPCQTCPPSCAGDVNGDCIVDLEDILLLFDNWSTSAAPRIRNDTIIVPGERGRLRIALPDSIGAPAPDQVENPQPAPAPAPSPNGVRPERGR